MRLAGRSKLLLHAEMEGHRAVAEPRAPATGQLGRLGELRPGPGCRRRRRVPASRRPAASPVERGQWHRLASVTLLCYSGSSAGKQRSMVSVTSLSHAARCSAVLVTTTPNMRREKPFTPHRPKMQFFHRVSSGSPKALYLACCGRVGRVEHHGHLGLEQSDRHALAGIALQKLVRHAGTNHAVDPALQDGRRLAPPVRMHDDDAIGCGDLRAVLGDLRRKRSAFRDFVRGQTSGRTVRRRGRGRIPCARCAGASAGPSRRWRD